MSVIDRSTFPSGDLPSAFPECLPIPPEAEEILSLILEQLEGFPSPQRGALLLSRDPSTDRSELLRYLARLLEDPDSPHWTPLLRRLNISGDMRPKGPVRTLFIQVPLDPSIDLRSFFLENLWQEIPADPTSNEDVLLSRMRHVSSVLVRQSLGLVVLEKISDRIRGINDAARVQQELLVYRLFFEAFSRSGILTVFTGEKEHLNPEQRQYGPLEGVDTLERCYSWIDCSAHPSPLRMNASRQEEEFQGRLQLLVYDWIHSRVPSWKPEHSPIYQHASRALTATLPEGDRSAAGLVYFKSVSDPYWCEEDITGLKLTAPPWVLMILSPCERVYEFQKKLKELVSLLPVLLVWRPATPSKTELDTLRSLVLSLSHHGIERDAAAEECIARIRLILFDLYIKRGSLVDCTGKYSIDPTVKGKGIGKQLSARLSELSQKRPRGSQPVKSERAEENRLCRWATLLTNIHCADESSIERTGEDTLKWLIQSAREVAERIADLPEDFRTTRFWGHMKSIIAPLSLFDSASPAMTAGKLSFATAVDHLGRTFSWQPERLTNWKSGLANLLDLLQWLPSFVLAREYVTGAFPLGEDCDRAREALLKRIENPQELLQTGERARFDEEFRQFREAYATSYIRLHENTLRMVSVLKKDECRIDFAALRNLELLSKLQYMDRSYLNKVKLLAKWIQRNNCGMPVQQILKLQPRCYCSFNPCGPQKLTGSAAGINRLINEGIECLRGTLRRSEHLIMPEFSDTDVEDEVLRQVSSLLGDGPLVPLEEKSITAIQRIIMKHPGRFRRQSLAASSNRI
ncbi:MAG: hypothetical protein GXX84_13445 [Acidobacteria bacterium]|nr:hypothetical protein [Acidobacteriota bacterium]